MLSLMSYQMLYVFQFSHVLQIHHQSKSIVNTVIVYGENGSFFAFNCNSFQSYYLTVKEAPN